MLADDTAQLLELNQALLDSIDRQDWETYSRLCDPTLSAYEPEALGQLVEGMPFHKFYFDMEGTGRAKQSTITSPKVRLLGEAACVTFVRVVQRIDADGAPVSSACEETRIWEKQEGKWRHVHFHRSPIGI